LRFASSRKTQHRDTNQFQNNNRLKENLSYAYSYSEYAAPDVLKYASNCQPHAQANEVFIRVCATTVSRTGEHVVRPCPPEWGFIDLVWISDQENKFLGTEFGIIETVGDVTTLNWGTRIGSGASAGAHAGHIVMPETGKSQNLKTSALKSLP
jgi:hypothetical protein